ncbi:MAG TPA: hypothetical protein VNQ90_01890 [Chthoniobacteraceae bacterium]|nr:hypothetical protein [Chthoniobacteraceae bacterium]
MLETIVRIGDQFFPFITPDNAGFWITTGVWMVGCGTALFVAVTWLRLQTRKEK